MTTFTFLKKYYYTRRLNEKAHVINRHLIVIENTSQEFRDNILTSRDISLKYLVKTHENTIEVLLLHPSPEGYIVPTPTDYEHPDVELCGDIWGIRCLDAEKVFQQTPLFSLERKKSKHLTNSGPMFRRQLKRTVFQEFAELWIPEAPGVPTADWQEGRIPDSSYKYSIYVLPQTHPAMLMLANVAYYPYEDHTWVVYVKEHHSYEDSRVAMFLNEAKQLHVQDLDELQALADTYEFSARARLSAIERARKLITHEHYAGDVRREGRAAYVRELIAQNAPYDKIVKACRDSGVLFLMKLSAYLASPKYGQTCWLTLLYAYLNAFELLDFMPTRSRRWLRT